MTAAGMVRRARPLLGTLVEVGLCEMPEPCAHSQAIAAAFAEIARLQALMSRFDAGSDIARFNALPRDGSIVIDAATHEVLAFAQALSDASGGAFDISVGSAPQGWRLDAGSRLHKLTDRARLDLGGIAKGYIVDRAVRTLRGHGCTAGWVNAGGDLRAFGAIEVPIVLRDEPHGGTRPFAQLADGAFATSHFGAETRSRCSPSGSAHVSVAAPLCVQADALAKVVALSGDTSHPLLARYGAQAWVH